MIRARKLKDGSISFFNGNRKATTEEAKNYIKESTKAGLKVADTSQIKDPELRQYAGRVKGGVNRSKNALTDKEGKFLNADLQKKVIKKLGVDIEALKKAKDVDNIRDLFKDEKLKKGFNKLLDTGIVAWVDSRDAISKFDEYTDKEIIWNGEKIRPTQAAHRIHSLFRAARRNLDAVDVAFKITYVGLDKVIVNLPHPTDVEEYDDAETFNEDFQDSIIVYASDPKKKKK
jgi:hypothetical protein